MSDAELNIRDRGLVNFLLSRRSVLADTMSGPGPSDEELRQIIEAGMRVPREGQRFARAPVVVAVVSRVTAGTKIPEWEQILSSGAACQTMLIAALSMGYAAQWLTEWYAYDPQVGQALGLEGTDRIAGFLYLGNAEATNERARPNYDDVASEWHGPVGR